MISVAQALELIRGNIEQPERSTISLNQGLGQVLANDFLASYPSPGFDNSAMDGFALRFDDVKASMRLAIVGESRAGVPFAGTVAKKSAIRISTGAMLPEGLDTVVRIEDTALEGEYVLIQKLPKRGQDIRYRGEEYHSGDLLIAKNCKLTSRHLAILAAARADKIEVVAKPKVAVLVTGSELISGIQKPKPGQICDSNQIMLTTAIQECAGKVIYSAQVKDDLTATIEAIKIADADIVICSGGVSVGSHDHVKEAAMANGFSEIFWQVQQKPGKPMFFAKKEKTLLFGLPGNPVSAYVCFCHYIRPTLSFMGGNRWQHKKITGVCRKTLTNHASKVNFLRVQIKENAGELQVSPLKRQGSHMLTSIVAASGYVQLNANELRPPGEIEVFLW